LASPETVDAAARRWVIPFSKIERVLREKGAVKVILAGEGEATDVEVWARVRGYRVARSLRTAAGIEVVLEAPRAKPQEAAPPGEARERAAPRPGAAPAAAGGAGRRGEEAVERVSERMVDPLFRVDLLLASVSTRQGELKAPTSVEAIARIASEAAGSGQCAHVEAQHDSGASLEVLVCEGRVEGIVLEAGGEKLRGSKALERAGGLLEKGKLTYRIRVVPRDFVERLKTG
jgi:hypothetical protein